MGLTPQHASDAGDSADITATLDLLRQAQDGSRGALESLFGRYYDRVRAIVRLRLGRQLRGRLESGDILQETFVDALGAFDRFEVRDEAGFLNWLARIAEHQIRDAADYHGAQKRALSREVPLTPESGSTGSALDPACDGRQPEDEAVVEEQRRIVEECIADLSEDYRELIVLRDYVGASWDAIAKETGRPSPDAARMKHATAMVELAKRVQKAGGRA